MAQLKDSLITGDLRVTGTIYGNISGNAATATILQTTRTINGTNFNGSANITTANWGTARNIYIADSDSTNTGAAVSVNGSGNATLKLPATIKATLTGNADTATIPVGFNSRSTNATWGNTTGATITAWNDGDGGSIDFRKNNPSSGKTSIKVDGRFYFNEGSTPVAGLKSANSYWGMTGPDGEDNVWIRTTSNGILPYQSGGKGSGHQSIGTSSWYFSSAYIDNVFARNFNSLITGSGTAASDKGEGVSPRYYPAKWTFNTGANATDGNVYTIKIPVAGHSYGVFMSVNNGTNYYPVVLNGTDRVTTHYGNGTYIQVVFEASGSAANMFALNGADARATVTGGVFRVINYYDSNTTYSAMSVAEMRTGTATSSRVIRADYLKTFLSTLGGAGLTFSQDATNGIVLKHSNSVTAATAGTSSATSGATLAVPYVTYDAQGHITASGTHTHTIGSLNASAITAGTLPIARGGTGATTRLNAAKNLTNENVGSGAQYFVTLTSSWGKFGYSSIADAKTALGFSSKSTPMDTYFPSDRTLSIFNFVNELHHLGKSVSGSIKFSDGPANNGQTWWWYNFLWIAHRNANYDPTGWGTLLVFDMMDYDASVSGTSKVWMYKAYGGKLYGPITFSGSTSGYHEYGTLT